ncbi:hypothetical protein BN971_03705 [Mycobacterium bohemicum DSM 44277]|uniref:Uncharacterized protein n=1 Tax=Mycobacterium bohemicum DSM 44277 TaxID=1236609 RepID=A0A0U0WBJ0_MYCBE|nr:hypothetical protein BN971_03705 [Mycobacterium bohemicum DSM 44277]
MSRRWAMWSRVVHSSRTAGGRGGLPAADLAQVVEFLCGPSAFALLVQDSGDRRAQLDQQLHVQGGVIEPFGGQRAPGPVGRAVALDQSEPEEPFDHGRQVHPVESGQPPGELGVVERGWPHAHLREARQVLVGGVQDPFVVAQHLGDGPQRGQRVGAVADRVDQHGAGAGAPDLDQVRAVGVAEPRGPLGVDGERPVPAAEQPRGRLDLADGDRQRRNPVGGTQQRRGFGLGSLDCGFAHVRRVTASRGR